MITKKMERAAFQDHFEEWLDEYRDYVELDKESFSEIEWELVEWMFSQNIVFWYKIIRNHVAYEPSKNFRWVYVDIDYPDIHDYLPEVFNCRQASLLDIFSLEDYFNPKPLDDFFREGT